MALTHLPTHFSFLRSSHVFLMRLDQETWRCISQSPLSFQLKMALVFSQYLCAHCPLYLKQDDIQKVPYSYKYTWSCPTSSPGRSDPQWCVVLELKLEHKPCLHWAENNHSAFNAQKFLLYMSQVWFLSNMSTFQNWRQLSFPAPLKTLFPGQAYSGLFATCYMA